MNLLQAFILGIIQGLTEFIPVSSTAHLLITQKLLGINDPFVFSFLVLVQLGTIVSLIVFFWKDLLDVVLMTLKNLGGLGNFNKLPDNAKMGWYIIIATIPALLAGYLLKDAVEALFKTPLVEAAIRLLTAAALLALAERFGRRTRQLNSMTWLDALVIGVMQIVAVFPGASRSGTTISGGMFRGLDRPAAARFAFLMSVPVMLAAGLYQSLDVIRMPGLGAFLPVIAIGFVTAGIVGWLAIRWLMNYLNQHSLYIFAAYCAVVGVLCVALQFMLG